MHHTVRITRQRLIVSHNDKSLARRLPQLKKQPVELLAVMRIKASRRLVSQNDARIIDKSAGHRRTLAFTPRKLIGAMLQTVAQTESFEQTGSLGHGSLRPMPPIIAGMATFSAIVNSGNN